MTRLIRMLLCAAVGAACAVPAWAAADPLAEQRKAQNKLLAYRAARVDAIRKLAERIKGLRITSQTTVKDFVAESDTVRTALEAFLSGMKEVDKPKYMEDGTCEITLEVTLVDVIVTLEKIHNSYYKGSKFKVEDFEKMTTTNEVKVLRESGSGAPRPDLAGPDMIAVKPDVAMESLTNMSAKAKAYWMANCMPQGRLMAVRAARVDAMRRLAERIKGVAIVGQTTVRDFVAESDQVNVSMDTFLKGARETGICYHDDELIVEVEMQVKLRTVYATLREWGETHYKGDKVKISQFQELETKAEDVIIKETGMGVPRADLLKGQVALGPVGEMVAAGKIPDWVGQTMKAVGNSALDTKNENKAQAKLMAFRAAELDGRRKLAEQLSGLAISSNTSVKDFVAQNDEIGTSMLTFQQGAHVVEGSQKLLDDGTAQVTVEIELRPMWDAVVFYQKKFSIKFK
jgi:hypothetical protein